VKRNYQRRHVYPSARSSVCMEQLGYRWSDFHEILDFTIFLKSVDEIQVSFKSDKNNGCFTRRLMYIYDNIALSSS